MRIVSVSAIIAILVSSGCSGTYKHQLEFNPGEPIRVAVLPFAQVDAEGRVIKQDYDLAIDNIPLVSSSLEQTPPVFLQNLVQTKLTRSGLDLIPPSIVEAKLSHAGFWTKDGLDAQAIFTTDPKELGKLLDADALFYGKLMKWERSYYLVQSVSTVGLSLELRSVNGGTLFRTEAEDSDSRGLTKGPTGFTSVALEPIRGLDNEIILDLARDVVEKALTPLEAKDRPEFLNTPPPAILASAHDESDGIIEKNDALTVVLLGSTEQSASFSIGEVVKHVPMVEKVAGHYIGEFYPLESDSFNNQPVRVFLTDKFGRTSAQTLGRSEVTLR